MEIVSYVCGFAFDLEAREVALIRKQKPDFMKGKLNGIGGKIEQGELASEAMAREFQEETSYYTTSWERFCFLEGHFEGKYDKPRFEVHFYRHFTRGLHEKVRTVEGEEVVVFPYEKIRIAGTHNLMMPNLQWLIPMALSVDFDTAKSFSVVEEYGDNS